ncbi:coiled-coil domain-containing protein 1-like isoform X2 [Acanthaster planci]|uniref:Coiled-coil domain-containing protein 1-like isoform X2 n=1 Tax=Acanthaster planci TaxID=133434 RepID=A0A8B7XQM7_ACAPL|nr:coiled-coil domain-containing protein 1-like isoform X2 [Acanthaster planci]
MECLRGFHVLLFCTAFFIVSSAPVGEPEAKLSKRHDLTSDKEELLEKIKDLENELQGRRSSQVPGDDSPVWAAEHRKKEVGGMSTREWNLEESLLKRGSKSEVDKDDEDSSKEALKRFLDREFESGKFVDHPFSNGKQGQTPGDAANKFDKDDLMAMLDDVSIDDLKKLLSTFEQHKRDYDSGDQDDDGEDDNSGDKKEGQVGDGETEDGDDDGNESGEVEGFLQGISVEELKELIEIIQQKKQDGELTAEDMGKVVYYLMTHLTTEDLQVMLDALRAKNQEDEGDEMTDEELGQAIKDLVSHISTDQLKRILLAIRARKQELDASSEEPTESVSSEDGLSDRELKPHLSEEEVMQALMNFLAGLSDEDLQNTILAVKRKKTAMKHAVGDVAGEYLQGDKDEDDDDDDDDTSDDLGPCAEEKQDILDKIEDARLANKHSVVGEVPNCDGNGFYAPKQCSGSICYCVDKHGTVTKGEATLWEAASLVCSQENDNPADTSSDESDDSEKESSSLDSTDEEDDDDNGDEEADDEEEAKLEQVERDLLDMLKEQKRHQMTKNEGLNM